MVIGLKVSQFFATHRDSRAKMTACAVLYTGRCRIQRRVTPQIFSGQAQRGDVIGCRQSLDLGPDGRIHGCSGGR